MPSTIYTQHTPEMYGAGSGLRWLGDHYTYEQVTSMWPSVKWSYLYSGFTLSGAVSDYSMVRISGGMQSYWNAYSGMYLPGCYEVNTLHSLGSENTYLGLGPGYSFIPPLSGFMHIYSGFFNSFVYVSAPTFDIPSGETYYVASSAPGGGWSTPIIYRPYLGPQTLNWDGSRSLAILYSGTWINYTATGTLPPELRGGSLGFGEAGWFYAIPRYSFSGVVETRHTYSGSPSDAWKEWTQDEAAIMEAYERTVGSWTTDYSSSGNAFGGSVAAPKEFIITPGEYNTSFGHIWFHTNCNINGNGARFIGAQKSGTSLGTSPTWRSPTGNEAKAMITIGADRYVRYDRLGPFRTGDSRPNRSFVDAVVTFPALRSSATKSHIGLMEGAGIRFLGVYTSIFNNVNIYDYVKYGVIFSADDLGMSYNTYNIGKIYGAILVAIKWRLRNGSNNQAWFNNSRFIGGHIALGSSKCTGDWDPDTAPTVLLDNDNSNENPNRDLREDIYTLQPTPNAGIGQFGVITPTFWADNVATEGAGHVYFLRASGWTNINWTKGRFEGMEEPLWHSGRNEWIPKREWWLAGNVSRNTFVDTVSNGALEGVPSKYLGRGIDFVQYSQPLPGGNYLGGYTPFNRMRTIADAGLNKSTYIMSHDLYLNSDKAKVLMPNETREKLRSIYVTTITDPVSGKEYPVVKAKSEPYVWIKWKAKDEPDSYYSTEHRQFAVGTTVRFKFGDFESIPRDSFYNTYIDTTSTAVINAPLIKSYHQFNSATATSLTYTSIFPSGVVDGKTGTQIMLHPSQPLYAGSWTYWNDNVINDSYIEADYTFNTRGICRPRLYMIGHLTNGGRIFRFDANYHLYTIKIDTVGDGWAPAATEEYEPPLILGGGPAPSEPTPEEYDALTTPLEEFENNSFAEHEEI